MRFPSLLETSRLQRMQPPSGLIDMVIDTDTYNEIDDQFALVYALLSAERLRVNAIYAAPFHNERSIGPADGMEKSYDEICTLLDRLGKPAGPEWVFRGATRYLPESFEPVRSAASLDLVRRAMARQADDPLYVVGIAAITNIASALLIEPALVEKVVLVWLGGHALHWPDTAEFNLRQDTAAAQVILNSGVPMILIPCMGVTTHLHTSVPEVAQYVRGRGAVGDYLYQIFTGYAPDHPGWSKVIWDMAAVAYLLDPHWVTTDVVPCPVLTERLTWRMDESRHAIRCARFIQRDPIFHDLFHKLDDAANCERS